MKKNLTSAFVAALFTVTAGCSSSPHTGGIDESIPVIDADTDGVPYSDAESGNFADPMPGGKKKSAKRKKVAPSPAGSGSFEDYTVQTGDTLMKIAFETYGDLFRWKGIYEANNEVIKDPNSIPAGTVLKVERPVADVSIERNGDKYLIRKGDTLGTISNDVYGTKTKWKRLWENNQQLIQDPNKIFAGFYLYYTMTPEDQAEAEQLKGATTQPAMLGEADASDGNRAPASQAESQ